MTIEGRRAVRMTREQLKERVRKLPMQPGVYMHKDKTGKVIYVGKAKLLKNRVSNTRVYK